jgi:ferredoxin, 2Fe-2S
MHPKTNSIDFVAFYEEEKYYLTTYEREYRSLMTLLKDKINIEDFGQCGGMGRCGTCSVTISGLPADTGASNTNERNTLLKMGVADPLIRLSCHIEVNEDLKNATVQVLENFC